MSHKIKATLKITAGIVIITLKITRHVIMSLWIMTLSSISGLLIIHYLTCKRTQAQGRPLATLRANNKMIKQAWRAL